MSFLQSMNKRNNLGFFMYEGKAALNKGTIYDLAKPPKKSLEYYMNQNQTPISFLDFSNILLSKWNKWIFNKTVILESGTMQTLITPAEQLLFAFKIIQSINY